MLAQNKKLEHVQNFVYLPVFCALMAKLGLDDAQLDLIEWMVHPDIEWEVAWDNQRVPVCLYFVSR